jgi:1-acyl-sn-glycerol-3-phosphate acyltransferase
MWRTLWVIVTGLRPLFCRLHVEGAENMPETGGCVVACNHTMGPDYALLGYASPRQIHYMAKSEVFEANPLMSLVLRAAGVFPVRRGQQDAEAIDQAVRLVQSGYVLGMFPEGTRSRTGKLMRGKSGVARIALLGGAPVVPAVVINAPAVLPNLLSLKRRPEVTVRFGKPICRQSGSDLVLDSRQFTQEIMAAMAALLPEELRGDQLDGKVAPVPK